ncbi:PucR family transcriptional regulator [Ethanoligenens sp.]|uniref:PucR family transcriptional regulator n=1 Tax=Ethanoligenens sp. TaxID=2099655 RepID=UPI0039EC441F
MEISIQWLMQQNLFKGAQYIAGKSGAGRLIKSINIMDNPDTVPWLKQDELILSTGYLFTSTDLYRHIIADLDERGCCGLAIKMSRYIDKLPKEMLDQANALEFPIIPVSFELSMEQIVNLVYRKLFEDEMSASQHIASIYKSTIESVMKKKNFLAVLKNLSDAMNIPVFLATSHFEIIEYSFPGTFKQPFPFPYSKDMNTLFSESDTLHLQEEYRRNPVPMFNHHIKLDGYEHHYQIFPITQRKRLLGYLVCLGNGQPFTSFEYELIDNIQSILSFVLMSSNLMAVSLRSNQDLFYSQILSGTLGSEMEIRLLCQQYGFDYLSGRICVTLKISGYEPLSVAQRRAFERKIWNILLPVLNEAKVDYSNTVYGAGFVLFLRTKEPSPRNKAPAAAISLVQTMLKRLTQAGISAYAGISRRLEGATTIHTAYTQSLSALELGQKLHPKTKVFSYDTDWIYHIISANFSHTYLADLYNDLLKPLEDYDVKNNAELMKTLHEFLSCGQNVTHAAKILFIHRNTMMYRLDQIRSLIDINYDNPDDRFAMHLGFYIRKMLSL